MWQGRSARSGKRIVSGLKFMGKIWLCAIGTLLLAACGRDAPPAAAPAAPKAAAALASPSAAALKIKGFYLGMDIHGVPDAMVDLLAEQGLDNFGFTDVIRYSNGEQCVLLYDKGFLRAIEARMNERYDAQRARLKTEDELHTSCYASDGVLVVKAGADGAVSSVEFNNAGELFGDGKQVQPQAFVAQLMKEYRLPALQPNDAHNGWIYLSPDGTRLQVLVKEMFGIPVTRLVMTHSGA
jgi:hypothetical protein